MIACFPPDPSLTKGGRRMFPVLRVAVHGLDPETLYDFKLDFLSCDHYRWRFVSGQWQTNGKQDNATINQDRRYGVTSKGEPYSHPKSPNYGRFWMSDVVEFKNVKLTNRINPTKDDHVRPGQGVTRFAHQMLDHSDYSQLAA